MHQSMVTFKYSEFSIEQDTIYSYYTSLIMYRWAWLQVCAEAPITNIYQINYQDFHNSPLASNKDNTYA